MNFCSVFAKSSTTELALTFVRAPQSHSSRFNNQSSCACWAVDVHNPAEIVCIEIGFQKGGHQLKRSCGWPVIFKFDAQDLSKTKTGLQWFLFAAHTVKQTKQSNPNLTAVRKIVCVPCSPNVCAHRTQTQSRILSPALTSNQMGKPIFGAGLVTAVEQGPWAGVSELVIMCGMETKIFGLSTDAGGNSKVNFHNEAAEIGPKEVDQVVEKWLSTFINVSSSNQSVC